VTRLKQYSILVLAALILTLGNPHQPGVSAATRPVAAPQATSRFVVFEGFLSAG
jgi:hypothetical protein